MPGGLFGGSPMSQGGLLGLNAASQQQAQPQQVIVQQPNYQGVMPESPGFATMNNLSYGWQHGGLLGAMTGAAMGSQGTYMDPQMAQMQLMGKALQSLPAEWPLAKKLAVIQDAALRKQQWGFDPIGSTKLPNGTEYTNFAHGGGVGTTLPPEGSPYAAIAQTPTKMGDLKVGDVSSPVTFGNGRMSAFGLDAMNPNGGGLKALMDLSAQSKRTNAAADSYGKAQGEAQQAVDAQSAAPPQVGQSSYVGAPIPPGVNPAKFRQDEATRVADANKELRTKADGSIDFLPDALRVLRKVESGAYKDAIGPLEGSNWYNNFVRAPLNSVSSEANKNLSAFNQLNADMKRLSTKNLKAQFGGRITNVELEQNNKTFGGAQASDDKTAANILRERVQNSFENLQRAIDSNLLSPNSVPRDVAEKGVSLGMLKPESFGMKSQQSQQMQSAPAAQQRQVGQVYQTPKGPMKWMGGGWAPVQ